MTPPLAPAGRLAAAALLVIVGIAAALRFWRLGAGIPYLVGPDESQIMDGVVRMMKSGDPNPHFFDWPSLTLYLNLAATAVSFLVGSMRGAWSHLDQVSNADFYLAARQFTALLGTATVVVTFAAGRRWGVGVALMAAALVAVNPSHVRASHFVLADVSATFFAALALWLSLRAHERRTTSALMWAAASAGLAASCHYSGLVAFVMPLAVAVAAGGGLPAIASRVAAVAAAGIAAFLAGTPYAVLDLPTFLNDVARLASTLAGDRREGGWSVPLPLYPVLCVVAAVGVVGVIGVAARAVKAPWGRRLLPSGVALALLVMPAAGAINVGRSLGTTSTVGLAFEWLVAHVPAGATVAVEAGAPRLPPAYRTVVVRSLLDRSLEEYRRDGVEYLVAASPTFQAALANPQDGQEAYTRVPPSARPSR